MVNVEVDEKQFADVMDAILSKIADKLLLKCKENTILENAIATGYYYRSFEKHDEEQYVKSVGSTSPVVSIIEYGSSPHRPPFDAIYKWVQAKKGESGEDARTATWKIIAKIAREGTRGKQIITKSVVDIVRELGGSGYETFIRRGRETGAWRSVKTGRFAKGV